MKALWDLAQSLTPLIQCTIAKSDHFTVHFLHMTVHSTTRSRWLIVTDKIFVSEEQNLLTYHWATVAMYTLAPATSQHTKSSLQKGAQNTHLGDFYISKLVCRAVAHFTNSKVLWSVTYRFREFHFPYMGIGNIDYIHSIKRLELLALILTSYKIFKTCFQIKDILFMFMFIRNKLSMPM